MTRVPVTGLVLTHLLVLARTTATLHSTELQRGQGPRRYMEWRLAPLGRAPSLRDREAVQRWFPEWEAWPMSRRRLWGLDSAARNTPLGVAQDASLRLPVLSSTVVPKASL